tara:strand:+ start:14251 stop:14778 length:528 start_codon:yes stop_codon:yes gene_type:complete
MILITGDLYSFFLQQLAPRIAGYELRPQEGVYIADLLAKRSEPQKGPTTLFDLYKRAVEEGGHIAASCFREIGDRSLFLVGVFPKHLTRRRGVGERYYRNMGASAYASLANITKDDRYQHLANGFDPCVNLIRDTMKDLRWSNDPDKNNLIEGWIVGGADGKSDRERDLKKKFQF